MYHTSFGDKTAPRRSETAFLVVAGTDGKPDERGIHKGHLCDLTTGMRCCWQASLLFSLLVASCTAESCIDKFCPPGTFCDERLGPCKKPPCRPIFVCLPDEFNGCARHSCPSGEVCVERVRPCIGKSCKKLPSCAKPGTCDAMVCPPSHKCEADPTPKCVKHIPTVSSVIGKAQLAGSQRLAMRV
ncbi:hypothetical protein Y032_0618g700 [Ancylostoma ceylanicum]|uniref:Uncharacterized protein n=2 Tax=Ancylostoma ceylanicum TaxID=53326 RepID=A0A016WL56_9BILA|nr:hypothetical protein Y032_0618g700 [Ancylostoma ceylanicum]